MNIMINEQDKKEFFSKYDNNTSDDLLKHLKRRFPVFSQHLEFSDQELKLIVIDEKVKILTNNKKTVVNKIFNLIKDDWSHLSEDIIRRTVKKFIDLNLF